MVNSIVSDSCCVELGNSLVLDDVSFSVDKNSLIAVVGPNGGGKTTLFNAITGLVPITNGSIRINGEDVRKGKGNIGYVSQNENLNWNFPLTARQVVNLGITRNLPSIPFIHKNNNSKVLNNFELDKYDKEILAYSEIIFNDYSSFMDKDFIDKQLSFMTSKI